MTMSRKEGRLKRMSLPTRIGEAFCRKISSVRSNNNSEVILGRLAERGFMPTLSSRAADVIIINTCSFIRKAREESRQIIRQVISGKSSQQRLIICGCLPQLEKRSLFQEYPEIDALLGSADFPEIDKVIAYLGEGGSRFFKVGTPVFLYDSSFPRLLSTPPSYAYLKIAEGCSNNCSYCLIPHLRGKFRSRIPKDILREARALVSLGVKELILIAQDTTLYGFDLKGKSLLTSLLASLEEIDNLLWIRILYAHPSHFSSSLVKYISTSEKVCPYIDLPLQHSHPEILRLMGRPRFEETERLIEQLRARIPGIALRTTLMVGFPGEKAEHFQKILQDVERLQFDWLGAFVYSPERGTPAFSFSGHLSLREKKRRYGKVMTLQRGIVRRINQRRVGETHSVLIDEEREGHCQFQAPEIDGRVFLLEDETPGCLGTFTVRAVEKHYDLVGARVQFSPNWGRKTNTSNQVKLRSKD